MRGLADALAAADERDIPDGDEYEERKLEAEAKVSAAERAEPTFEGSLTVDPKALEAIKALICDRMGLGSALGAMLGAGLAAGFDAPAIDATLRAGGSKIRPGKDFFGPDGKRISKVEWERLQADPNRVCQRNYQNPKIRVRLLWRGTDPNPHKPLDQADLFEVEVCDRMARMNEVTGVETTIFTHAPDSKCFPTLKQAAAYYDYLVLRFTDSFEDAAGKVVEVGNELAPPSPDRTTTVIEPDECW